MTLTRKQTHKKPIKFNLKVNLKKTRLVNGGLVVASVDTAMLVSVLLLGLLFVGVWLTSLIKMSSNCPPGKKFSLFWISTLVLGLLPTGLTQLAALLMAMYGLKHPQVGCR